ncbi:putative disease resistance RPP13 protein [Trifolium repens]|nr:putative disease resistance RPP13 protein [Trifolium repens]
MFLSSRPQMHSVTRNVGRNGTTNMFTISPPLIRNTDKHLRRIQVGSVFRKIPPTDPTVNSFKLIGKSSITKD